MSRMLRAALMHAELGFAVFPVAADCKPGRLAWEGTASGFIGLHDASRDPGQVEAFWARYPAANISTACGAPSGTLVVDVDVRDGFDGVADLQRLEARFDALPATWRTRTPSGGLHLWFDHPTRPLTNRVHIRVADGAGGEIKTGLDCRTTGGCVPLPPSAKPSGRYVWEVSPLEAELAVAPAWLLDIIDPPLPPRRAPPPLNVRAVDRTVRYVQAALANECRDLAGMARATGRNARLFQAAANLGEFVGARLLPEDLVEVRLERAAQENGLWAEDGPRAVLATIRSGLRKGIAHPREVAC